MKKYRLLWVLLLFVLSSCNKWLDVKPEDEIDEGVLFSSGTGYRHALNGLYYALGDGDLYGQHLTWGMVDALGQCYIYANAPNIQVMQFGAAEYDWDNQYFEPYLESMWKKVYNMVANSNNIIKNIAHDNPEKFTFKDLEKSMIWGEALALRAFVQFDMLRLFAPAPVTNPGERTFIPYVSDYPVYVSVPLTVDSCLSSIIRDLKEAKDLLWKTDSGRDCREQFFWSGSASSMDDFYKLKRGYRLNYYATSALLARVYMYAQRKQEAYNEAKALIDFAEKNRYFEIDDYDLEYDNFKAYGDMLWGLESVDLLKYETSVNSLDLDKPFYISVSGVDQNFFGLDMKKDSQGNSQSNDLRFQKWLAPMNDYYKSYRLAKHTKRDESNSAAAMCNTLMPMIRISEMYYIAAEAIYEQNLDEAKQYLLTVKTGRGLYSSDKSVQDVKAANKATFLELLINDARREWLGEGQIFYLYKRLNKDIPYVDPYNTLTLKKASEAIFVAPVPNIETDLMQ